MVGMLSDWAKTGVLMARTKRRKMRDVTLAILNLDVLALDLCTDLDLRVLFMSAGLRLCKNQCYE